MAWSIRFPSVAQAHLAELQVLFLALVLQPCPHKCVFGEIKKRSKACLKYNGPGGIQTAKPNAAALHLMVWPYGGDAARRRARWAKFQILTAFPLIFDATKKIEKYYHGGI